jgi:hypothetical protein
VTFNDKSTAARSVRRSSAASLDTASADGRPASWVEALAQLLGAVGGRRRHRDDEQFSLVELQRPAAFTAGVVQRVVEVGAELLAGRWSCCHWLSMRRSAAHRA